MTLKTIQPGYGVTWSPAATVGPRDFRVIILQVDIFKKYKVENTEFDFHWVASTMASYVLFFQN